MKIKIERKHESNIINHTLHIEKGMCGNL